MFVGHVIGHDNRLIKYYSYKEQGMATVNLRGRLRCECDPYCKKN